MKTTILVLSILIAIVITVLFVLGSKSKLGQAPGLISGKLSLCSNKPNCVCSEYNNDSHYIEPMTISDESKVNVHNIIKKVIQAMGGTIQIASNNYISASFSSAIFGFVDDFEIRLDLSQKIIHVRSASRVGHGDLGVNKKRVELFKALYSENIS